MAIVREKFKFIGAEKFAKEVRKYPALYDKSRKSYMEKDSNYHSAKKSVKKPKLYFSLTFFFSSLLPSSKIKIQKIFHIIRFVHPVIYHFLKENKCHEKQILQG